MHIKKHLSFSSLRKKISARLEEIGEHRQESKIRHSIHDVFMSGFAMMYFQDPSVLQFQKRLEDAVHNNNLKTLFRIESIPKDSQMKEVMDELDSRELEPVFGDFFLVCVPASDYRQQGTRDITSSIITGTGKSICRLIFLS